MRILFVLPQQVHLLDISGPIHVFYEAVELGLEATLHFINLIEKEKGIKSSSGLFVAQIEDYSEFELGEDDLIFVPGLEMFLIQNVNFQKEIHPFLDWLKSQAANKVTIASVCTGAFLLAQAGLLRNIACTTHWKYVDKLQKQFPKTKVVENRIFVNEKNIYTSAGVTSGIDLALLILEERLGSKLAADVAREVVVYFRRGMNDPQLSVFLQYRNHLENRIHEVQNWIQEHLSESILIENLAELVHVSPRHLTRLFRETTGITIGNYIERLRIEKAFQLLSEKQKVDFVAHTCGLQPNQLRHLLKKYHQVLPSEIKTKSMS